MSRKQKKNLFRIVLSAALLLAGVLCGQEALKLVLLLTAYLTAGYDVLYNALRGIGRGQLFDESFLMSVATIGAVVIGEYAEAAAVMVFYQLGEWFQSYAVGKSRASIAELMDICPETAWVRRAGQVLEVAPEEVEVGETLLVKPGEKIPLDGTVLSGTSSLNTAALTGESLPREVQPGDTVVGGCVNLTGALEVRAEKEYADSTVARILELVETAADKKSKAESFITRFARYYTPIVCTAALLLFLLPPVFFGGGWAEWGRRALSFLVVSCPCALVISVPLSFFGGVGAASRHGILMKGSNYLEALANTWAVVLDKTGTLTHGSFRVTAVHPNGVSEEELLTVAAAAESHSNHPISHSICRHTGTAPNSELVKNIQEIAGQGIVCQYKNETVAVGNLRLMEAQGITAESHEHSGTVVHVSQGSRYLGHIVAADELKESAVPALSALRSLGVRKLVMLTGDSAENARTAAEKLGLDQSFAQLMPDEKVKRLEELLAAKPTGKSVAFVGDGINDAPVLTRADIGIAMGAMGSDAAVEAADIVLMDDDPAKLATAMRISRKTMTIARQNIVFALAVKAAVLVLAAFGIAGMWLAVFADVGVSFLAVLNAMRTLRMSEATTQL